MAEGGTAAAPQRTAGGQGESSAWAPFSERNFRWLWPAVLVTYLGAWMQVVGAQWLLVDAGGSAATVALVQTATTLPIMLLALPAGVLADVFDRRWLLFTVQVYVFVVAGTLALLTAADLVTPAIMLTFTFLLGIGAAVQLPTWQALMPELVRRHQLGAAIRLDAVGVNFGRSAGPALAGLVITVSGVAAVFVLNALSVVFLAVAVLRWRRAPADVLTSRERFLPALRAGGRYVWHESVVRRILIRALLFIAPGTALWALLPLVARERLAVGPNGYGAMFGALGVGAIVAALVMGRVRGKLSTNLLLAAAGGVEAVAVAVVVLVPSFVAVLLTLVFAGLAWTAVISTLIADLQMFLPVWVRARGLAVFLVVYTGSQAIAAVLLGQLTEAIGIRGAFLVAAGALLGGVLAGLLMPVPETGHLDREPAVYWPTPRVTIDPEPDGGPVLIQVHYTVAPERQQAYLAAMGPLRRSRLSTGATRWELYRDAEQPDRFVEQFRVPSWEEHMRQHEGRLTGSDQAIEEAASAFSDPPVYGEHLLSP